MAITLTSAQRKYIKKRTKMEDLDPSEKAGELNIIPFLDIVVNLIMFLLATTEAVMLISQIETDLPKISKGRSKGGEVSTPLNLNVTVTEKGVIVSGSGGKLAPGCQTTDTGRTITVPIKNNGQYDWKGLTECAARVKATFKDEDTVTVSANPQINYEYVVMAMDAIRNKGKTALFPKVLISVGMR
jgi:biopolymer transport protein TolR